MLYKKIADIALTNIAYRAIIILKRTVAPFHTDKAMHGIVGRVSRDTEGRLWSISYYIKEVCYEKNSCINPRAPYALGYGNGLLLRFHR